MLGISPVPLLREIWTAADDADLEAFLEAVAEGRLAGALAALEGTDEETREADGELLDTWADTLARRAARASARSAYVGARLLRELLGEELGFTGEVEEYHAARTCCLHQVLALRRGMPILLSSVWIEVGRRAGIAVDGVGMPRHFLARIGGDRGVIVDPFSGGTGLTREGCRRLLEKLSGGSIPWSDEFLKASPVDEIVERVLANLIDSTHREGDGAGTFRVVTFLAALRPELPERRLQKGAAAAAVGAWDLAASAYGEVLEDFPDTPEADDAAARMDDLSRRATVH